RLPIAGQGDGLAVAFTDRIIGPDDQIALVRTNSALVPLEPVVIIDVTAGVNTDHPSITSFSDGSLWVAYTIHNSATDWDIIAKRVDAAGNIVGGTITIFNDTDRSDFSDLATLVNGNVVAVFQNEFNGVANDHDIWFRILTPTGTTVSGPTFVQGGA